MIQLEDNKDEGLATTERPFSAKFKSFSMAHCGKGDPRNLEAESINATTGTTYHVFGLLAHNFKHEWLKHTVDLLCEPGFVCLAGLRSQHILPLK